MQLTLVAFFMLLVGVLVIRPIVTEVNEAKDAFERTINSRTEVVDFDELGR